MRKQIVLVLLFAAALTLAFRISVEREFLYLFWTPVLCALSLIFLLMKKRVWFVMTASAILFSMIYKGITQNLWWSSAFYFAAFLIMAYLIERIHFRANLENKMHGTVLDKSRKSLILMKRRFKKEETKIQNFQEQVDSLTRLFEAAKDFNVCLTFENLLETVRKSVLSFLRCKQMRLLLLPSDIVGSSGRGHSIAENKSERWLKNKKFTKQELSELKKISDIYKIETRGQADEYGFLFGEEDLHYPLWIFPLKIENNVIALLFLEGAREKDFYQFQIIAGQLALQIQKTLLYEKVHSLSLFDGLTQVSVRRHFEERIDEELRRSFGFNFKVALLMLDLDHFKLVNDRFGHLVGDRILRGVADIIRNQTRTIDLVGRFGGEEFIVMLPDTDRTGGLEVAERIRSAVAKKRFKVYDGEIRVTVSIGVAFFPDNLGIMEKDEYSSSWKQALIDLADSALYLAKDDGRNQVKAADK